MLFDMQRVSAAMAGGVPVFGEGAYRRAALDISGGGDEQVLAVCEGTRAWIEWAGFEKDDSKLVTLVARHLRRCNIPTEDCLADNGGLGKIVINEFDRAGFPLRRFDFNGEPRDKSLFLNARAEAYFHLADRIRLGHLTLPDDDLLREELSFAKYDVGSDPIKRKRLNFDLLYGSRARRISSLRLGVSGTDVVNRYRFGESLQIFGSSVFSRVCSNES